MFMEKDFSKWLVVSDIDGTLNNKMRKLPRVNYDAIKKFTEMGGNFTLASGRLTSSLERNYNRITPNQPAIVLNGAGIYDFSKREMIWRRTIGEEGQDFVRYVIKKFSKVFSSVDVGIYFDDHVYVVKSGLLSRGTMHFDKAHFEITSLDRVPKDGWMKVIFWSNPLTINKLKRVAEHAENAKANFMSSSPWSFEMLQEGTHKGTAIMELAKTIGIDKSHVAAIGDYYNDWDMLKTVGLPACAGQAPKPIHEICKFEACHCNKGCVADLLQYIMSGRAEHELSKEGAKACL